MGWREGAKTAGRGALALLGGLALAAIHLAPFFELISQTTRTQGRASSNSWPLSYLLRMVMPQYFNTAAPGVGPPMVFNDLWTVGILPLLLAAIALVTSFNFGIRFPTSGLVGGNQIRDSKSTIRKHHLWFWAGMGLLAVLVTFGIGPFLYARWLPGLQALLPMRIGYLLIFSIAFLAGFGYDAWLRLIAQRRRAASALLPALTSLLGAVVVWAWMGQVGETDPALKALKAEQVLRASLLGALSIAALAIPVLDFGYRASRFTLKRVRSWLTNSQFRVWNCAALGVLAADLLTMVPGYNTFVKPEELIPPAPSVAWLKAQGDGLGRVMGVDSGGITFNPNMQSLYGFPSVNGYDSFHWRRYEEYWSIVDPTVRQAGQSNLYGNLFLRPQAYTSTVASLLDVRYVAAAADLAVPAGWTRVYSGEIEIYSNPNALPRAFLVSSQSIIPSAQVRERLAAPDFDPRKVVLLEQEEAPPNIGGSSPASSPGGQVGEPGSTRITSYRRNSVTVEVNVAQPSWLILADPNYPGWGAKVDGREQRVYTAYYLLRAVPLTPGEHTVEFSYWPTLYWPSMLVSLLAVAIVLGVIAVSTLSSVRARAFNRTLI